MVATGAFGQDHQTQKTTTDNTPRVMDYVNASSRIIEDSGIGLYQFYYYAPMGCCIVTFYARGTFSMDAPIVEGALYGREVRRFPRLKLRAIDVDKENRERKARGFPPLDASGGKKEVIEPIPEYISKSIKYIRTGPGQFVEILTTTEPSFFSGKKVARLFIIQPNSEVAFPKKGERILLGGAWAKNQVDTTVDKNWGRMPDGSLGHYIDITRDDTFVLMKGSISEDKNFSITSDYDELLKSYANVSVNTLRKRVDGIKNAFKAWDSDFHAQTVIGEFLIASTAMGAIAGVLPIVAMPLNSSLDAMQYSLKASMAYCISLCYGEGTTTLKDDLYYLFADPADRTLLHKSLDVVNSEWGSVGQEAVDISVEQGLNVLKKRKLLEAAGDTKKLQAAIKKSGLMQKVGAKFTLENVSKSLPFISIILSAGLNAVEADAFGTLAMEFYRPEQQVKVVLDANWPGAPKPVTKTVTVFDPYGDLPPPRERTGYNFLGWDKKPSGGAPVISSDKVTAKNDHALYAQWFALPTPSRPNPNPRPNPTPTSTVTITLNFNDSNSVMLKPTLAVTRTAVIGNNFDLPKLTKTGLTFLGWYTLAAGGTPVASPMKVTKDSPRALYAHWKTDAPVKPVTPAAPATNNAKQADYRAYQSQIQKVCNFSNPEGVWKVIEQFSSPQALYQNLANNLTRPKTKADLQAVIQARYKFPNQSEVWQVMDRHSYADSLYRVLAQALVGSRPRATSVPSNFTPQQKQIQMACNFPNPEAVWKILDVYVNRDALYYQFADKLSGTPSKSDNKEVIQAVCKFSNPGAVWSALDKHPHTNDLYRMLAQGLVGK